MSSFKKYLSRTAVGAVTAVGAMLLAKYLGYDLKIIRGPGGFSAEYYPPRPSRDDSDDDESYREIEEARRREELAAAKRARDLAEQSARRERQWREEAQRKSLEDEAARFEFEREAERLRREHQERLSREEAEQRLSPAPQAIEPGNPRVVELPPVVVPAEEPPAPDPWEPIVRKRPPKGYPPWVGSSNRYVWGYPYLTWRKTIRPGRRYEYGTPGAPGTARDELPPSCLNNPLGQPLEMCPQ